MVFLGVIRGKPVAGGAPLLLNRYRSRMGGNFKNRGEQDYSQKEEYEFGHFYSIFVFGDSGSAGGAGSKKRLRKNSIILSPSGVTSTVVSGEPGMDSFSLPSSGESVFTSGDGANSCGGPVAVNLFASMS